MTGAKYLDILTDRFIPELNLIYQNRFNRLCWIQDGAPAHGIRPVREFLQGVFTDRIIALHHAIEWPPRSLELTSCQKQSVLYSSCKHRRVERILNEINMLKTSRPIVRRVIAGMRRKLQLCIERNGRHITENRPHL